jgi:hypothetical protein
MMMMSERTHTHLIQVAEAGAVALKQLVVVLQERLAHGLWVLLGHG